MRRFILTFLTILTGVLLVLALLWALFVAPVAHAENVTVDESFPATYAVIGGAPAHIGLTQEIFVWALVMIVTGLIGWAVALWVSWLLKEEPPSEIEVDRSLARQGLSSVNERRYARGAEWIPKEEIKHKGHVMDWPTHGYDFPPPTNDDLQDGGNISSVGIVTNFPSTQPEAGNHP